MTKRIQPKPVLRYSEEPDIFDISIRLFIDILRFLVFLTRINREDAKNSIQDFLLRVFLRAFASSRRIQFWLRREPR
jgi:hypothetical protein